MYTPCPVAANYHLTDLPIDGRLLPGIFLPSGEYYCTVELRSNETKVVSVKAYFEVPAGKNLEDDRMG